MAKRWAVTIHTIKKSGNTYTADLYELGTNLVSGKLTLRMNDTSTLKFSAGFNRFRDISPVKSLVEVRFGEGTSWDTKFFGTITKRSRNIVEGIESYEAVGVLGSYRFLPNYDGYTDSSSLTDILDTEQKRFRGEWSSSDAKYTPSAWELLYQGQSWVPQNYGLLVDTQWFFANAKMSCNLGLIQKNSKNAYEFLKAITKDGSYVNETQYENGKWFEKGALAEFRPIIAGDRNDQNADYRYNLLTVTVEDSPSCSRVEAVNKGSKQAVTSGAYPNPFYSARIMASDKSDGTTYTSAELQKIANNELLRGTRISEATCFDRHVIDDTIPWFDLSKYVYVRYAVGNTYALEEMQISEISYDLCDSTKDRVKLGAVQKALTDSTQGDENAVQASGGTMTGDIIRADGNNSYNITELAKKNVDEEYYSSQSVAQTTSLGDTGVKVTLPKGWYMINAQVVANRTSLSQIALAQVYSAGNIRILAFNEVRTFGSNAVGRLQCSWCGYIDETSNTINVWTKSGGTSANTVSIWAKRIASDLR